VEWEF
jgi:hypothetical protein